MTAPTKAAPRRRRVTTTPPLSTEDTEVISPGVYEVPDEEEGSRIEEKPPNIPTPTVSEQVESLRDTAKRATERVRAFPGRLGKPATRKTGFKRPRVSVEGLISSAWSIGSRIVGATGAWPVANVLALQSPVAGKILEGVVKDTVADSILQPFARMAQGGEVGFALLGPPVLVGIATVKPESQPIVEPLLREALKAWLHVAGPKLIEKAKEEAEFEAEYGQTIDAMIRQIFTPPPGMEPTVDDRATVVDGITVQPR